MTRCGAPPVVGTRPSGAVWPPPPRRPSVSPTSTETPSRSSSDTSPSLTTGSRRGKLSPPSPSSSFFFLNHQFPCRSFSFSLAITISLSLSHTNTHELSHSFTIPYSIRIYEYLIRRSCFRIHG